jgi:AraC-like DNA-binding protein
MAPLIGIDILRDVRTPSRFDRGPEWHAARVRPALRRVMAHIGRAIAAAQFHAGGFRHVTLNELASVACWSPEHFVRVYSHTVGESPMATVRRLGLAAAARMVKTGARIADVADLSGYGSEAAFNRAFVRAHGLPPLRWWSRQPPDDVAPICMVVHRPTATPCHGLPYAGRADGIGALFDETVERLGRAGAPRAEWHVCAIVPRAATLADAAAYATGQAIAAVEARPLSCVPKGFDRAVLAGGWFAVVDALDLPREMVLDAALRRAGWQRVEGDAIRVYETDPVCTAPPERRERLHVAVAPITRNVPRAADPQPLFEDSGTGPP